MTPLKVAVIGAGAAGLSALRHLAKNPHIYQPVAFEQAFTVGGTWVYTERTSKDEYGLPIHASMYQNLRLVMGYQRVTQNFFKDQDKI